MSIPGEVFEAFMWAFIFVVALLPFIGLIGCSLGLVQINEDEQYMYKVRDRNGRVVGERRW